MNQKDRIEARLASIDAKLDLLMSEIKHVGNTLDDVKKETLQAKWTAEFSCYVNGLRKT